MWINGGGIQVDFALKTIVGQDIFTIVNNPHEGPLFGSKKSKNFESVFKISRKTFDYICSLVKEDLAARQSNFSFSNGKPLSPNDMVAIALRRLSSGESLQIIGDTGFPLLPWLLTPYQGKGLSDIEAEYNKRHSATRMVAQMALARLKDVWRIIHGVMWMPDKNRLPRIVLVCCLLHNIVIDMEDEMLDELPLSYHHDSGYHQQTCESVDKTASVMRDNLSLYLSGKLPP
ncbi:hypothetical protein CUMW_088230 [Citrus unshiu]|nr:hypothetical protein CUMW_088230 [Citrus unshiu]